MIERIRKASSGNILRGLLCALTAAFYIGAIFSPDLPEIFTGFWKIISNPAVLTKDYFFSEIGSVSGTMLNFALTGTFFCALMFLPGATINGVTLAAYGLSVGFCSYGINFLNIMPFQIGILIYSKIKKMPFVKNLNLAMFSCALGPLVSEVLFRYPGTEVHGITLLGVVLALAIGIARKTLAIVRQNIVFSLVVKIGCLLLTALGITNMWWAIFADVGVMVLAVLNATRALRAPQV